ncbi:MAG TPA: carboxypeptidase-like regulatory domain-containing protein [Bacteroidales bacterium]|nr:carboxypeptidase-like regulatory domain-containing protein [Bacteroidales bacterium]
MKVLLNKIDKYRTIARVIDNYSGVFEGFAGIIAIRDNFFSKMDQINELYSELSVPKTELYGAKHASEARLRNALKQAIGTGITVAISQNNVPLLDALRSYKTNILVTRQHELPEVAIRVYNELMNSGETALGLGLTEEKLSELQNLTNAFREEKELTDYKLNLRKNSRSILNSLVSECGAILRDKIDPFADHCKVSNTEFYSAYATARGFKHRKKRRSNTNTELAEITGTVTDSITGLPLANAVINLAAPETIVNTDEDGMYALDELEAGTYTVSCHLEGYDVPASVTVTVAAGDSPVVDFALVPAQQAAA